MSITIRKLTEADVEVYRAIRLRALNEEPEAFGSSYEEEAVRPVADFANRLSRPPEDNCTFGAFDGETLVGIVTLVREDYAKGRHKGLVLSVYVASEARRKGVGRLLMQALIDHARTLEGLEQLHLAVGTAREAPRNLYLSMGFAIYGTEPRALKLGDRYIDEEYMVLRLART